MTSHDITMDLLLSSTIVDLPDLSKQKLLQYQHTEASLVGGPGPPLWKIWLRQLGWFDVPNINGKITFMFQTTNQIMDSQCYVCFKQLKPLWCFGFHGWSIAKWCWPVAGPQQIIGEYTEKKKGHRKNAEKCWVVSIDDIYLPCFLFSKVGLPQ